MKRTLYTSFALTLVATPAVNAADLEISITNLTQGIYYTPFIISAHNSDAHIFETGKMASPELQALAEGGDISLLSSSLANIGADVVENPAEGLLAPTMTTTTMLMSSDGNGYLSLAAMLLPTNDGFVGLDSWVIPTEIGTYTFTLNAFDAGTEANDEIVNGGGAPGAPGIPVSPGGAGTGGSGLIMTEVNNYIHVHPGNIGDDDETGGKSDLSNTIHRWLNPVAKVTVVVK